MKFRNDKGLFKDVEYKFDDYGLIDWKQMINVDYIVPYSTKTNETDLSKLQDHEKLILLQGFKDVAKLAGIRSIEYTQHAYNSMGCSMVCKIHWLETDETRQGYRPLISSGAGDATLETTSGFGRFYLTSMAENRAFTRAVKCGLNINILCKDEIGHEQTQAPNQNNSGAEAQIQKNLVEKIESLMQVTNIPFDKIKGILLKENTPGIDKINKVSDLPRNVAFKVSKKLQSIANRQKTE